MKLERLDTIAQKHHGLVNLERAKAAGISRSTWYRGIASGQFEQLHPNVVRLWGSPSTLQQRALAAVWAAGGTALASHRTAAALWGVERPPGDPIDIILPDRARHARPADVTVHRPRDLEDLRPIMRQKVPTTNPMRMLLDLGAVDPGAVAAAMISVMSSKVASPAAIRGALFRHAKKGRRGVTALHTSLEAWLDAELPPDSALEAAMNTVIAAHGLPPMRFHPIVAGYEVDFLIIGSNIVIECDGWGSHGLNRDQFEFDRLRNIELVGAGYHIAQVTWRHLANDPHAAAERILKVVTMWAPHLLDRATTP
jgi:very-short-patch-repair endonuclease